MRSQHKLIADSFEKIVTDSKAYMEDLVNQGKFPMKLYDYDFGGYGGYTFWDHEIYRKYFADVRTHIPACHAKAIELKKPEFQKELLGLLKNDPEGFIAALGMSDNGTGKYYSLPVLDGIGTKEFVDQYLAVPFEHWRALYYFLSERMRRSQSDPTLQGEQKWFVDLVSEMNDYVVALGDTIAAVRLKRHIPEVR